MVGEQTPGRLKIGAKVRVAVPTDHPEDPIGAVVMFLNDNPSGAGGVLVQFPRAGAEVHRAEDLEVVPTE
jgi:hypothetical protein